MISDVLLTHASAELYGSDRMALETVRALRSDGLSVLVVLPVDGPLRAELERSGATVLVHSAPVLRKSLATARGLARYALGFAGAAWAGRRIIKQSGARLTYVNTIVQPTWIVGSWLARVPSVLHVREAEHGRSRFVQWLLTYPARLAASVVANSAATRDSLASAGRRVLARTTVVHNGKDWDPYFTTDFTGIAPTANLLYFGRLSPRKGVDLAVDACATLVSSGLSVRLSIAGDAFSGYEWYETQLREQVRASNIECKFLGFVDDAAVVLNDADIVVVPSRQEPFGTVAAEAMAAMRPVVVARVDGLTEVVNDRVTGLVVAPDDSIALASAVRELIESPELAARLARAGYDDVRARFSPEAYERAILGIVQASIATRNG